MATGALVSWFGQSGRKFGLPVYRVRRSRSYL
jgi:hypothetical protein